MFKRITPQTIADWGERIYIRFLELTKRFTSTQIMALLAIIVGVLAGLGTCLFELLLYGIKAGLTHWFPVEQSHFLFLFYPVIGIILASLFVKYVVKDNISEGVTRVMYAMSRKNSYIASHNCWTSVVGGATTLGFGGSVGPEAPCGTLGGVTMCLLSLRAGPTRRAELWLSDPGCFYTVQTVVQLWRLDRLVEASDIVPFGFADTLRGQAETEENEAFE